jgi:hypothetical protein
MCIGFGSILPTGVARVFPTIVCVAGQWHERVQSSIKSFFCTGTWVERKGNGTRARSHLFLGVSQFLQASIYCLVSSVFLILFLLRVREYILGLGYPFVIELQQV